MRDISSLMLEFEQNRNDLKTMIEDIEKYKDKLEIVFPEKFDNRYKKFFEEKIKAITLFFNALLDIRKEINKSLKDEIELTRKLEQNEENIENEINIRDLATKIEMMNKGEYLECLKK
jgi:hypothetical protein